MCYGLCGVKTASIALLYIGALRSLSMPVQNMASAASTKDGSLELFVPGRVCLFGEHTDWAGSFRRFNSSLRPGRTIVVGTNSGLFARVRAHPSMLVITTTTDKGEVVGPFSIPMNPKALLAAAAEGGFFSYAAGVAYQVLTDYRVCGVVIDNYRTTLPLKKGLSSSAAVCVLVARAFNRVYDLKMTTRGEMAYAYSGEITTPSRCGRMDQACAFGPRPVVMTYDGDFLDTQPLRVPVPLHLVLVDLCAKKDTIEILSKLQSCFPFAQNEDQTNVQRLLGPINEDITTRALKAIEDGRVEEIGALMVEAQKWFDEYAGKVCPSQLTAPVLHKVLNHAALQPYVLGGKGVGAGGDGTAQFLCRTETDQQTVAGILERDFGMPSLFVTIAASSPVTKAVIPAAGFGAGLFPATKCTKAELFPIVNADGVSQPAILMNVEELISAGIEEVIIIVQPEDLPAFERLFKEKLTPSNYQRLSATAKRHAARLLELGEKVRFVVQDKQEGFGHAIWTAREAIGRHPFMVVLGDHLYKSTHPDGTSCASQVISAFQRAGAPGLLGLKRSPLSDVTQFGTVTGVWMDSDEVALASGGHRLLTITELCEKPSPAYASAHLTVPHMADEFLTVFGMYVVPPMIFDILDHMITNNVREGGGYFQFTTALDRLRKDAGLAGYVVEGARFDLGSPEHYFEALMAFHDMSAYLSSPKLLAVSSGVSTAVQPTYTSTSSTTSMPPSTHGMGDATH